MGSTSQTFFSYGIPNLAWDILKHLFSLGQHGLLQKNLYVHTLAFWDPMQVQRFGGNTIQAYTDSEN